MFISTFQFCLILLSVSFATLAWSAPIDARIPPYPLTVVAEFPSASWVENLAVRENGDLLVISLSLPSVFLVEPFTGKSPILVASISQATGVAGIAELEKDVFYVAAGNISGLTPIEGSMAVRRVNLRPFSFENCGNIVTPAKVELVASFPDTIFLNGMCRLSSTNNSKLLISDSILGSFSMLDVNTKTYAISITNPAMSAQGSASGIEMGINGIHVFEDGELRTGR
ncbi:hypothetical protein BKA61DRAFT_681718 [Leptodontidium sp. MPI-SDFR-AT-0119]|nr:hypothetical protein BKA61DRAFT_681718 [Leptodontidium sp. MPI-SDFR-AT-0119]